MMAMYSLLLAAALLVSSPWWLMRMATTERYREGMRERLGHVPLRLRAAVAGKRVVWVHAVSVGEVLAGSRLLAELGEALGPDWVVVVSTTTRTGQKLARERFGDDRVFYLPFDFATAVRRFLQALQPAAVVLMESEVWPRLLEECRRRDVPVCVVNARVSDRSFRRSMKLRKLWAPVLRKATLWLAQSDDDASRLTGLGVPADRVRVAGNLKYDVRAAEITPITERLRTLLAGRPVVVAGSTTAAVDEGRDNDEEQEFVEQWKHVIEHVPDAVLILAPRHPERFPQALAYMHAMNVVRASMLTTHTEQRPDAVLLDTIGDLASVYRLATVAFIGGSLVARGGHNPLEPAQFAVPVILGRHYENFRGIVTDMRAHDAIRVLEFSNQLPRALVELLTDPAEARAMGERGRAVFEAQGGATRRAVEAVLALVHSGGTR